MENYTKIKRIGSGSFAKVYLAEDKRTGKKVALKVLKKESLASYKLQERLFRELDNMELLRHPGIVEYYESFETKTDVYIAMEYVPGGELFDYIADKGGLPEDQARKVFKDVASAIAYCHKTGVAHRDLKLENILLTSDEKPKVIDFGFSKEVHQENIIATYCGSALYASPEMIQGKAYRGPECDVWSLGVILYCMLTASMPFDDTDWHDFVFSVKRGDYPQPNNVSESARLLISRMLDPYAKTRATMEDVLSHSWLNPMPRKASLQLPVNKMKPRRQGISHSHSSSEDIRFQLIQKCSQTCVCKCHKLTSDTFNHCEDCKPISDNLSHTHRVTGIQCNGTLSVSSSGYCSTESLANSKHSPLLSKAPTTGNSVLIAISDFDEDDCFLN